MVFSWHHLAKFEQVQQLLGSIRQKRAYVRGKDDSLASCFDAFFHERVLTAVGPIFPCEHGRMLERADFVGQLNFLNGGGAVGALMRAYDWSRSPAVAVSGRRLRTPDNRRHTTKLRGEVRYVVCAENDRPSVNTKLLCLIFNAVSTIQG